MRLCGKVTCQNCQSSARSPSPTSTNWYNDCVATERADGWWIARKQVAGKRHSALGRTNQEAEQKLADLLHELSQTPPPTPPTPILVTGEMSLHRFYHAQFRPRKVLECAEGTVTRYDAAFRRITPTIGLIPLQELTPQDCQVAVDRAATIRKPHLSPASVRYAAALLNTVLRLAYDLDAIPRNPYRRVALPKKPRKRIRVLPASEAVEVVGKVAGHALELPVFLAITLGLRRGEIAGLKWDDLDRRARTLHVQRQRIGVTKQGVKDADLKTEGSNRRLLLPAFVLAEIDRLGDIDNEYISTYQGRPWVPDTITEFWAEMNLMDGWTFHDLRHAAAGLLHAAGASLLEIAAVLGHAKPDMTLLYTASTEAQAGAALDKLGAIFGRQE